MYDEAIADVANVLEQALWHDFLPIVVGIIIIAAILGLLLAFIKKKIKQFFKKFK